jgi:hypothetical protein
MALTDGFSGEKGTLLCRELLGIDIRDEEAKEADRARIRPICQSAIVSAVELLDKLGV